MTDELDLLGMFEGLPPEQVRELTARIRSAVLNEYQSFRQEKRSEVVKIREPLHHASMTTNQDPNARTDRIKQAKTYQR